MSILIRFGALLLVANAIIGQTHGKLIELDEENWRRMLDGEWMVEFFAPWCPACKSLTPVWESFARRQEAQETFQVAKIDVTKSPALSGRFFVTALPTIFHVMDGEFRQYRGSRDLESLMNFVTTKKWKSIEPVSSWKNPASVQMSIVSYFFKLSHILKDINTRLHDDYGMPTWGSYALFAVATIFLGAVLGLMLVCLVDFLYPPKKQQRQSFSEVRETELADGQIEELAGEEIEDDEEEQIEEASSSEAEKNSGTDEENDVAAEEEEEGEKSDDAAEEIDSAKDEKSSASPPVRHRKTRKAD